MSLIKFYTTTFTIYRMENDEEETWGLVEDAIDSFQGHLQQLNDEFIENLKNVYTLTHKIWCDLDINVKVGDKLTSGEYAYSVKTVNKKNFAGKNQHLELLVEQSKE